MSRFSEELLERARRPTNLGRDDDADLVGSASWGGGPPSAIFYLRLNNGRITTALFEAAGCGVTIAACSALTEIVASHSLESARLIDESAIEKMLGPVPVDKQHCLTVAIAALRNALDASPEDANASYQSNC